jgi:hypothetical protein
MQDIKWEFDKDIEIFYGLVLFYGIYKKMDGRNHHVEQDRPSSKTKTAHGLANLWNLDLK